MLLKRIWNFLSLLGVKKEMPLYKQKSIILFNQILMVLIIVLLLIFALLYFRLHLKSSSYFFIIGLLAIGVSLYFNYRGKPAISRYLISFTVPSLILALSILAKKELGTTILMIDISPKIGLIISIILCFGGWIQKF